jgi:demethylmenaquinone methyltransferase/2-methoxy-6-polyprenyl-1,4-benzoquinol methylase
MLQSPGDMALDPTTAAADWSDDLLRNPHAVADKRRRVQRMFAAIAPSYDLNNRLHSLWMDQRWRRKAVKVAAAQADDVVVDVACGTGDLTLAFARRLLKVRRRPLRSCQLLGIDFTYEMLPIAWEKSNVAYFPPDAIYDPPNRFSRAVRYLSGDALSLPLPGACCDVLSIAFGIRNVQDPATALREFRRVLRPGGRLIILEFSLPTNPILRTLYNFYFRKVLPATATLISRDKTGAYKYLPQSVNTFIDRDQMMTMMRDAGFERVEQFPLTFGVCVCYRGYVP